jgi:hypothetical protein
MKWKSHLVVLIENLHPEVDIEYQGCQLVALVAKYGVTRKVERQSDSELINGLTDDHFPHSSRDQLGGRTLWHPVKYARSRRVCC